MARMSTWDEERNGRQVPLPTIPRLALTDYDDAAERQEIAQRFATARTIKAGVTAWRDIKRSASFESYLALGRALCCGKVWAMHAANTNRAWGSLYSRRFGEWLTQHGFHDRYHKMTPSVRSHAIELAEHASEITRWRDSLPERQRRRLIHPLSVTRRWKAATGQYQALRTRDLKWEAQNAWRKFCACLQALPQDQSRPLWQAVAAEVAAQASA